MLKAPNTHIVVLLAFGVTIGGATCSAAGPSASSTSQATAASGTAASGAGGADVLTTATGPGESGGADSGPDPDAACGLITEQAKSTPLDLYIAFDKSSSMAGSQWQSAKLGLASFVNDPDSAGINVALNFFPLDNNPTCQQQDYSPPKVDFAPLPQNALPITTAMDATVPDGFATPIYPALGGAILGAKGYADNHPGHAAAVLLVTDGAPQSPAMTCGSVNPDDPKVIADLAAAGLSYGVKTFLIGLPGVSQTIANQIAAAGGTGSVILVSGFDIQSEFQTALAKVRGQALPCAYQIPDKVEGGDVDVGDVNVLITPKGGQAGVLPQDTKCGAKGWRYDDPVKPTKILLCPASCQSLRTDFSAKVQILLGCKTEVAR